MDRRTFLKLVSAAAAAPTLSSCGFWRIDVMHPMIRSDIIDSPEKEQEILSKAKSGWTDDGRVRVLYAKGTPYERGYQHGKLLRDEIQDNLGYLYDRALKKFRSKELFSEAYERMRPFMKPEYVQEMHGLAHGSKLPLETIHHIHVLADIGEWGGKKKLGKILKKMLSGELGTMCSNLAAIGNATADQKLYTVRILDWGLHKISRLHQYPLLQVNVPTDGGVPYVNIGWVGYLGAISGINAAGITLGEMGYRNPDNETLNGEPMPFMLRDVLRYATNLSDARNIIQRAVGTNSYIFVMSDGKTGEAQMYVKDRDRFVAFDPGKDIQDTKDFLPAIENTIYGGRYNEKMTELLKANFGKLSPELLMKDLIPQIVMESNFQNVIYEPKALQLWVSNAQNKNTKASESPYTFFDFGKALREF